MKYTRVKVKVNNRFGAILMGKNRDITHTCIDFDHSTTIDSLSNPQL